MSQRATLELFGDEQICIPGIDSANRIGPSTRPSDPVAVGTPSPLADQLVLGPNQILLWEAEPEPRQPSLLPEPPPWEFHEPSRQPAPVAAPRAQPEQAPIGRQLPLFA